MASYPVDASIKPIGPVNQLDVTYDKLDQAVTVSFKDGSSVVVVLRGPKAITLNYPDHPPHQLTKVEEKR